MVEITELSVNGDDNAAKSCSTGSAPYPGFSLPSLSKTYPNCNSDDNRCLVREELLREINAGEGLLSEQLPGGAPSLEETESALRDLQSILVQKSADTSADKFIEKARMADSASRKRDTNARDKGRTYPFTHSSCKIARRGDSNTVHCSADLLQHDPKLQATVVSLARDPAIWDACSKNKKFQELIYSMDNGFSPLDANHRTGSHLLQEKENPFLMALQSVRNLLWKVVDTVNGAFGFIDRWLFGDPNNDPLDRPFKAGIMLTVLLLALVVLRRRL